jgi:hypothetical protein
MLGVSSGSKPRTLELLGALFILAFFFLFAHHGFASYFTFDDGTTVIACLRPFETPFWRDILHVLTVFTTAFRPLTSLFWRPLYAIFGFNPLPFRIVVQLLLTVNLGVVYVLARRLDVTREAAALTTLVFCYNASMLDLFYNTCLVGDVLCLLLYGCAAAVYIRARQSGEPLDLRATLFLLALFFLAMDSKEQAVTLPGILVIYEVLYRWNDLRDKRKAIRVGSLLAAMFVADAVYLSVKVSDMSANPYYHPHVTLDFVLKNIAHYVQELLYLPQAWITPLVAILILAALLAMAALLRSRAAIFGVLLFVAALIPVAVIEPRAGYAAYIPYFGLALAAGSILAAARAKLPASIETPSAIALFLGTALLLGWAHMVNRMDGVGYYEWSTPGVKGLLDSFERDIPDFPPNARVLLTGDPWGPDWGPMFLVRLLYHDNSIWVDRPKNMTKPPDVASYDLVVSYQVPDVKLTPARFLHRFNMNWEMRGRATGSGQFSVSSPAAHDSVIHVDFTPQRVHSGQSSTATVRGLANVPVNIVYRIVTKSGSTSHVAMNWCTLNANGQCSVTAPSGENGEMMVDWIQPANQRWIFTSGNLTLSE